MIPCLHFGLRHVSGRFTIEPKLASWVESGYKSPESPGPRQRGRRRDRRSRRRRGQFRSTAPYPAATNSRGVSKPSARRDNGLTFYGDRSGTLADPFGHSWTIATHVEDVSPEEMQARFEAAMRSPGDT